MKLIFKMFLIVVMAGLVQACGEEEPEEGCNFVQNSHSQRVAWQPQSLPVRLYIHKSVPSQYHADLNAAVKHWNDQSDKKLLEIVSFNTSGSVNGVRDGYNMVTWNTSWDSEKQREQGRTTIHWSTDIIYEADVKINAAFKFAAGFHHLEGNQVHFKSLMIHEFGHVLGLGHNEHPESVMKARLGYAVDRSEIKSVDVRSLSCEYEASI